MTNEVNDEAGPRAEVNILQLWEFRLSKRDAMLILQALGGRSMSPERTAQAKALGDRLTALRVRAQEQMFSESDRLRTNLENATGKSIDQLLHGDEQ